MKSITIDRNCLINLKNKTGQYKSIQKLINDHKSKKIKLCIPAISASEFIEKEMRADDYTNFIKLLEEVNCKDCPEVLPMGYWGISYWDHALYCDDVMEPNEKKIHEILFPNIEFDYHQYCKINKIDHNKKPLDKKWVNAKCDVQSIWSHIHANNDIFVTEDRNFLKESKKNKLEEIGAKNICTPDEALKLLNK